MEDYETASASSRHHIFTSEFRQSIPTLNIAFMVKINEFLGFASKSFTFEINKFHSKSIYISTRAPKTVWTTDSEPFRFSFKKKGG